MRWRVVVRDRAQASLEYVALIGLVALVVGALLALTVPGDVATGFQEDWLRGRGDDPASDELPSPSDAAKPLPADATPVERLLHDKAQLSRIDYAANTDWWNASLGIGFGVALGEASLGFKIFGITVSHEHKEQTVTGDPTYAMAPTADGSRPWVDWKKCTQTSPVDF
jgi:hypothetical protein